MLTFLIASRQIFGLSNRWHTEINSSRYLAGAHMACLQKPGSCQTDQLQDTALNIPSWTKIFISANEECLLPDCVLDVDWKKACVDIRAARVSSFTPAAFFCILNKNDFRIHPGPYRNTIYLLVPEKHLNRETSIFGSLVVKSVKGLTHYLWVRIPGSPSGHYWGPWARPLTIKMLSCIKMKLHKGFLLNAVNVNTQEIRETG